MMQMQHDNTEGILRNLQQHRDDISSVDINEQASLMVVYERMFQAMAKYMNTLHSSMDTVMTLIS